MRDTCQYGPDTPQGVAFLPILVALALGWPPPRPWGRRPLRNQPLSLSPRASLAPHLVLKLGPPPTLPPCLVGHLSHPRPWLTLTHTPDPPRTALGQSPPSWAMGTHTLTSQAWMPASHQAQLLPGFLG